MRRVQTLEVVRISVRLEERRQQGSEPLAFPVVQRCFPRCNSRRRTALHRGACRTCCQRTARVSARGSRKAGCAGCNQISGCTDGETLVEPTFVRATCSAKSAGGSSLRSWLVERAVVLQADGDDEGELRRQSCGQSRCSLRSSPQRHRSFFAGKIRTTACNAKDGGLVIRYCASDGPRLQVVGLTSITVQDLRCFVMVPSLPDRWSRGGKGV